MPGPSNVFEENYRYYLTQLADMDFKAVAQASGGRYIPDPASGNGILLPFFQTGFRIDSYGITGPDGQRPGYEVCIILSRYLIMARDRSGRGASDPCQSGKDAGKPGREVNWTGFRDFKDAGPLTVYFKDNVEAVIAKALAGQARGASERLAPLGGRAPGLNAGYDLSLVFQGLPHLPLLLLFNEAEEGFPSSCSVLFASDAETFLDAECLAMAGYRLASLITALLAATP